MCPIVQLYRFFFQWFTIYNMYFTLVPKKYSRSLKSGSKQSPMRLWVLSDMHIYMCTGDVTIPAYHKGRKWKRRKNKNLQTLEGGKKKRHEHTAQKHIAQTLYKI